MRWQRAKPGDTAFRLERRVRTTIRLPVHWHRCPRGSGTAHMQRKSGVAASLCHRTPSGLYHQRPSLTVTENGAGWLGLALAKKDGPVGRHLGYSILVPRSSTVWRRRLQWRVECGEWTVESGLWRVDCGEWRVESGLWRVESGWNHFAADRCLRAGTRRRVFSSSSRLRSATITVSLSPALASTSPHGPTIMLCP